MSTDAKRRRTVLLTAAGLLAAVVLFMVIRANGLSAPTPTAEGSFSFAVLGDAPYYRHEEMQYRLLLRHIDAHDLSAVIHVGDIFWKPCSDAMYVKSRDSFDSLRHPVIYTPGDNEWTDCWEPQVGAYVPLERLEKLRQILYQHPVKRIALTRQPGYVENVRWSEQGVIFATVHVPGSRNAREPFPGRTAKDDLAATERTAAAAAWIRETFANAGNASAVVIAFHARPPFLPINLEYFKAYQPFLDTLAEESARFGKPVLVVHGDEHEYKVDHPVPKAPNLTRMEVPGSPDVGWVRVTVQPGAAAPFSFEKHVVPEWKYW